MMHRRQIRPLYHAAAGLFAGMFAFVCMVMPAVAANPDSTDAWEQLQGLQELAPSRHLSQPGNAAMDAHVQSMFEAAVAERQVGQVDGGSEVGVDGDSENDAAAIAQAARLELRAARQALHYSPDAAGVGEDGYRQPGILESAWDSFSGFFVYHLHQPTAGVFVLVLMGVCCLLAYRKARDQPRLMIAGAGSLGLALVLLIVSALFGGGSAATGDDVDLASLSSTDLEARVDAAAIRLQEAEIAAATAAQGRWQTGRVIYPSAVFTPGAGALTLPAGGSAPLTQITPNFVDPGNLPEDGLTGPLVYAGAGLSSDVQGKVLTDAIVLLDYVSGNRWISMVQLGARAVIFIEPTEPASQVEAEGKFTVAPVSTPRFYLRQADIAALGDAWTSAVENGAEITLTQEPGRWSRQELGASWILIPPTQGSPPHDLVHVQTHLDSNAVTPAISPGATGLGNLVAMKRLLRHFQANPPNRPVLLSVVNGHANGLIGEQAFAHTLFGNPDAIWQEVNWIERELAKLEFVRDVYSREVTLESVEALRGQTTRMVAGESITLNQEITDHLRMRRNLVREREQSNDRALRQDTLSPEQRQKLEAEREALAYEAHGVVMRMQLFNRFGRRSAFDKLDPDDAANNQALQDELAREFEFLRERASARANELLDERNRLANNLNLRRAILSAMNPKSLTPGGATYRETFVSLYTQPRTILSLNLDLTFGNDQVGLFPYNAYATAVGAGDQVRPPEALRRVDRLARQSLRVAIDTAGDRDSLLADTLRNVGGVPMEAYIGAPIAMGSWPVHPYGVPGLTLTTVRDSRPLTFTPFDTVARIDRENYRRIMAFVDWYLPAWITSDDLDDARLTTGTPDTYAIELGVRQRDQFSVTLPQTPLKDAVIAGWMTAFKPTYGDVLPATMQLGGPRGAVTFRGSSWRVGKALAFQYDDDFREFTATLDAGEGEKQYKSTLDARKEQMFVDRKVVAFLSKKVDLFGLTEPANLLPVGSLELIDAAQESAPRNFGAAGIGSVNGTPTPPSSGDGVAAVMLAPEMRFKIKAGQSLAINATEDEPQGIGFSPDVGRLTNLVRQSAQDMVYLTQSRLDKLSSAGVSSPNVQQLNTAAIEYRDEAEAALAAQDVERSLSLDEKGRGIAYPAYIRARSIINDLIRAAVFFLALVIPFCFFMTKLVSPYTDITRQLSLFGLVFLLVAIALWLVHPAFKIATTPTVVILAFVIVGLASYVAIVLIGRFNSSMNQAVEEAQQSESVDAPQGRLAGVAFVVGVNNMRRRRIRTTLTCATIVLVTFTMLSVISVGQDADPSRVKRSGQPPYAGILISRPGLGSMNEWQVESLRRHFQGDAEVIARAWGQRLDQFGGNTAFRVERPIEGQRAPAIDAMILLGMEQAEDGFIRSIPLAAGRWFSADDADEIILSAEAAGFLGIQADDFSEQSVILTGQSFQLVGLVDDAAMATMLEIGETPVLPVLSEPKQTAQDAAADQQAAQAALASESTGTADLGGGDALSSANIARPRDVAILPLRTLMDTPHNVTYRTLSVKYADKGGVAAAQQAWDAAAELIQWHFTRVGVGLPAGVKLDQDPESNRTLDAGQYELASRSATKLGGVLKVAIPIILAATIIFNTMLGSVMERRREVGIYNAIGLNPSHVMMFFLAESLVFGLVGAVLGYLIGQALSLLITYFDLLGLNLNYSSTSVMVVIFLTIVTVLLSTVYPAMMAARAAVPSGQRKWALPQPEGDEIQLNFPFSYDEQRVLGVCAYLRDFMSLNSEASTGKFLTKLGAIGLVAGSGPADDETSSQPPASAGRVPPDGVDEAAKGPPGDEFVPHASEVKTQVIEGQGVHDGNAYVMLFDVSPAPFDLGVNQKMEVYAYYNPRVRAHMLSIHLTRLSGEKNNWMAVNQPFLEALRKRLLGWRSQKPEIHEAFYREGLQLFGDAKRLPMMDEPVGGKGAPA